MTKAIPNFGCKSLLFVVKYTCQPQKSHNCHRIRKATKRHDKPRKRIEVARRVKQTILWIVCSQSGECLPTTGHNEADSKSALSNWIKILRRRIEVVITRRTRNALGRNPSRVRISPSPPNPDRKLLGFLFESAPHKCLRIPHSPP